MWQVAIVMGMDGILAYVENFTEGNRSEEKLKKIAACMRNSYLLKTYDAKGERKHNREERENERKKRKKQSMKQKQVRPKRIKSFFSKSAAVAFTYTHQHL